MLVGGMGIAALATGGCGPTAIIIGAGGSGGEGTSSHSSTGVTTATTGTGGMCNHCTPETAEDIALDMPSTPGALVDQDTTSNFYKFMGSAGDRIVIVASAQSLVPTAMPPGNDPTIADVVVTLLDANKNPIAQDDDGWPRRSTDAQLYTVLPASGEYYIQVNECHTAFPTGNCGPAGMVTTFDYELFIGHTDMTTFPESNAGAAQDGTIGKAVPITYKVPTGGSAGDYGNNVIDGSFKSTTDTHVFSFTAPADTTFDANQRPHAEFFVQPIGPDNGTGSTSNIQLWVTDMAGTKILAFDDQKNFKDGDSANPPISMSVPISLNVPYFLFVKSGATTSKPATDYYFIQHIIGTYYYGPLETEGATGMGVNDMLATAQKLVTPTGATAGSYFIDGDISKVGDVDWYEVDPPAGTKTVDLFCEGARGGSGLLGFTVGLFDATGTTAFTSVGPEAAAPNVDLQVLNVNIPTGTTKAFLKISATGQAANNTGTYYRCGVAFSSM
jgi:hypothetical protein